LRRPLRMAYKVQEVVYTSRNHRDVDNDLGSLPITFTTNPFRIGLFILNKSTVDRCARCTLLIERLRQRQGRYAEQSQSVEVIESLFYISSVASRRELAASIDLALIFLVVRHSLIPMLAAPETHAVI